jgi:putative sigma-54 modulation protein
MNVSITGRKVKLTPQLRAYIEKNMKKLDHYSDHIYDFALILERERHLFKAEVNIRVKKKTIHLFAKTHDIFSVVDTLYDKVEVKLRRYREKLNNHRVIPLKEIFREEIQGEPAEQEEESAQEEVV